MTRSDERGIALIVAMMVMMLMSALLVGFMAVAMSDQRFRYIDRDRNRAFYGANAGLEKMTADLGNLFFGNVAPTQAQLTTLAANHPTIPMIDFVSPNAPRMTPTSELSSCVAPNAAALIGNNGYTVQYCASPTGQPVPTGTPSAIVSGPYEGLIAQKMPYQLDVTARTASGGEVHLVRSMQAVAIPVFQFGIFSDSDLAFFAGPNFNFGGRIHTNGDLYLSQGNGLLTLSQQVTAVGEIFRDVMQNGISLDDPPAHSGPVKMAQGPNTFRNLQRDEGSIGAGHGRSHSQADRNEPAWHTVSLSTYNGYIRNGRTGAKRLDLSLVTMQGSNVALVQRPPVGEDATNPGVLSQRFYSLASLRILLSDTAADITALPGVSAGAPVSLDGDWLTAPPAGYVIDAAHPPIARSPVTLTNATASATNAGANRNITVSNLPAAQTGTLGALTVTKGVNTYSIRCTGKTASTVTGCTSVPAHTVNTLLPATATMTVQTADGPRTWTTPLTAQWNNGVTTVSFDTAILQPTTVWVGNQSVTCAGPNSDIRLSSCNVLSDIAANAPITYGALTPAGTNTIGGFIKIERGNPDGTYTDVTMEVLNFGIAGPNLSGFNCAPNPNRAIVRLQRFRDHSATAACPITLNTSSDYWPNALFDTREAVQRDAVPAGGVPLLGGVMYYVGLDAANLSQWFLGTGAYAAGSGNQAKINNGGYTVYFSDRRNNRNPLNAETGEYGFEDFVNPTTGGVPNNVLDEGEDVNGNGTLDIYGELPSYNGQANAVAGGSAAPLDTATARPWAQIQPPAAQVNRPVLFRRALKLTNGANLRALGITGLTIASENPTYVQGNWNAPGAFTSPDVASAVIADAVTLLSNEWTDLKSFLYPYKNDATAPPDSNNRVRNTDVWYRLAVISGKGPAFSNGATGDFGTDGGAHNFLRFLESGGTVNYLGSMASFFFNRQAVGTFKCCTTVYGAPTRNYTFDTNFLTPSLLPPNTPMFRDLNAVGFSQEMRPGR